MSKTISSYLEAFNLIFRFIFLGFIAWTFIWAFDRKNISPVNLARIDLFAVGIVMVLGVVHVLILIFNFGDFAEQAWGKYWFGFWMYPFTYFGLTQLLWIRAIRTSKIIRIAIAIWIFVVMYFEQFVILVTSLHRDYL